MCAVHGLRGIVSQNSSVADTTTRASTREGLAKLYGARKAKPKHANIGRLSILQASCRHVKLLTENPSTTIVALTSCC